MMQLKKTVLLTMASVLTACASTNEPLATIVNSRPPASAMSVPVKPLPPKNGAPAELLRFAARYGAYCRQLESNINIIIAWEGQQNGHNRSK